MQHHCPHVHGQNDRAERKHRHIVGLALLAHSCLSFSYWVDAFETAVYLINIFPSSVLKNKSPHFLVFNSKPDYKFIKVFGCEC